MTEMTRHEFRAPQAATITSSSFVGVGSTQIANWDTEHATRYQYYANVVVFASIRAIAQDVAQLAFRVGPDPDQPDNYSTTAPLARLLGPEPGSPNEEMATSLFWEFTISQLLLSGSFTWEVEYRNGTNSIVGLWPLMSRYVTPINSMDRKYFFSGVRYQVNGRQIVFPRDKALYYWRPAQDDIRQPESKLRALQLDAGVMVMQDQYDYAFLRNDARPAAVIIHEAFANRQDRDAWRQNFQDEHQGPGNAGKVHWVEASPDGATPKEAFAVQALGLSQVDAEFIKRYDQKLRGIVMGFGVPMSRLGDTSARTYSNADKEYEIYRKNVIAPVARELASFVNRRLAPRVGTDVGWFDLRPYEIEERNNKIIKAGVTDLLKHRVIKFNEARAAFALNPVDGGDRFMTDEELALLTTGASAALGANRLVITEKDPENLEIDPQPQLPEDPNELAAQDQADQQHQLALAQANGAANAGAPAGARARAVRAAARSRRPKREAAYKIADERAKKMERFFMAQSHELLNRQKKIVLDRLNGKRGRKILSESRNGVDIGGLFDRDFWNRETRNVFYALFLKLFQDAVKQVNEKYGVELPIDSPQAALYASTRAARLADHITDTTYQGVERQMREGAALGEPLADLEARIANLFDRTFAGRPDLIAQTEVMSAYNGANVAIARSVQMFTAQEWIATPDARTRDTHMEADGQVQPVGAYFQVGSDQLLYPGDPDGSLEETINCRCSLGLLTADEVQQYENDTVAVMTTFQGQVTDLARGGAISAV